LKAFGRFLDRSILDQDVRGRPERILAWGEKPAASQ